MTHFEKDPTEENRRIAVTLIDKHIRYLGSSDIAFLMRKIQGKEPAVTFEEILGDIAKRRKVELPVGDLENKLDDLVRQVVSKRIKKMKPADLEELLRKAGADEVRLKEFLKKHGATLGASAVALILKFFGKEIAQEVIEIVVINLMARYLGKRAATVLFKEIGKRFPWWSEWLGPIVWIGSGIWLALDLQGPAYRKTVPVVLYLGLCVLRLHGN